MKGSEEFKKVISAKLQEIANGDPLFAFSMGKAGKNIDDCITYILNTVKQSGCSGFSDEEVYGMAMHYYDEDNIEVGEKVECKVVTNHKVELSDDDIKRAKEQAIERAIASNQDRMKKKSEATKKPDPGMATQGSLF